MFWNFGTLDKLKIDIWYVKCVTQLGILLWSNWWQIVVGLDLSTNSMEGNETKRTIVWASCLMASNGQTKVLYSQAIWPRFGWSVVALSQESHNHALEGITKRCRKQFCLAITRRIDPQIIKIIWSRSYIAQQCISELYLTQDLTMPTLLTNHLGRQTIGKV